MREALAFRHRAVAITPGRASLLPPAAEYTISPFASTVSTPLAART